MNSTKHMYSIHKQQLVREKKEDICPKLSS